MRLHRPQGSRRAASLTLDMAPRDPKRCRPAAMQMIDSAGWLPKADLTGHEFRSSDMSDTLFGPDTQRLFADAMTAQIAAAEANDQNGRHGDGDLASRIIADLRTAPASPGPEPAANQTPTVRSICHGFLSICPLRRWPKRFARSCAALTGTRSSRGRDPDVARIGTDGSADCRQAGTARQQRASFRDVPARAAGDLSAASACGAGNLLRPVGTVAIRHGRAKAAGHIGPGGHSITPPHQVHELRTGDDPCLIVYAWTGDMTAENWWWVQSDDGNWHRQCWVRQHDASWAPARSEPLTNAEVTRSGDR